MPAIGCAWARISAVMPDRAAKRSKKDWQRELIP
jgi:hypothetical protein